MKTRLCVLALLIPLFANAASAPLLLNDLTYYVDPTNGVDTASGLSWAAAKRTIQSAVDAAQIYNFGTNSVYIRLANGTFFGSISVRGAVANTDYYRDGMLEIIGTTPGGSIIDGTNSGTHAIVASMGAKLFVRDVTVKSSSTTVLNLLDSQIGSMLRYSNVIFGAMSGTGFTANVVAESGGTVGAIGPSTITAGGNAHFYALQNGSIWSSQAVAVSNTPAFSSAFALADTCGSMMIGDTYTGSATGMKFLATTGGSIYTSGVTNLNYFPGSIDGVQKNGGSYSDGYQFRVGESNLVVGATGLVGIGTTNSLVKLDVMSDLPGSGASTTVARISRNNNKAIPGDGVQFGFRLNDGGSNGVNIAGIAGFISDTNAGAAAGKLSLSTKAQGDASPQTRMSIETNGIATFNFGVNTRQGNLAAPAAVSVGGSPTSYTNSDGYAEMIFVDGGTVSAIAINGTTVFTSTGKTVELQNGEYVTVTYTGAPTMRKKPL